jgi:hypothetical protein
LHFLTFQTLKGGNKLAYKIQPITVEFEVEDHGGEKHQVKHVFRHPTTTEDLDMQRKIAELKGRAQASTATPSELAIEWVAWKSELGNLLIESAKGYDFGEHQESWKGVMPLGHRIEGINLAFFRPVADDDPEPDAEATDMAGEEAASPGPLDNVAPPSAPDISSSDDPNARE